MIVTGRVQGVGFRANTRHVGRKLGLSGWVKNLEDGRVEALAEGEEAKLQHFLSFCRHGPPASQVTDVQSEWSEARGDLPSFEVSF